MTQTTPEATTTEAPAAPVEAAKDEPTTPAEAPTAVSIELQALVESLAKQVADLTEQVKAKPDKAPALSDGFTELPPFVKAGGPLAIMTLGKETLKVPAQHASILEATGWTREGLAD